MKVLIALSGGIDSTVAAMLLKRDGFEVIGVFIKLLSDTEENINSRCCSVDDITDVRRVCDLLDIPFYIIDLRKKFESLVIKPFIKAYNTGSTPIPCLICNTHIKFGHLFRIAKILNANLATGHYARIIKYKDILTLGRPVDQKKDQTYYLHSLDSYIIPYLNFPLGQYVKHDIRVLAAQMGINVFNKPDSNEICFISNKNYVKFLSQFSPKVEVAGKVINSTGESLGHHTGIHNFTIGQRRRSHISTGLRNYVLDLDTNKKAVVLGPKLFLKCLKIVIGPVNKLVPIELWPKVIFVQVRSYSTAQIATWTLLDSGNLIVEFKFPVIAISLGQAAAIYDHDILLGGALIIGRLDGKFPRFLDSFSELLAS